MGDEKVVLFEKRGHVGIFTLNRPKAMNAISAEVSEQLEALLDQFEADDDLWIGIIRSSHPKVFCAGADLKSIASGKPVFTKKGGFAGLVQYPRTKPLIACVGGQALAGGCEVVLACDLVVASREAMFGVPEVKRSLIAAAGGLFRLPRKLPHHVAMEMNLTGDSLPAERMYHFGFINKLVDGDPLEAALELAKRIEANAPLAVRQAKRVVDMAAKLSEEDAFKLSGEAMKLLSKTEDYKEGPRAFIEKRAPRWTGKQPASKL